ncbi:hypothetical protein EV421DRAFT_589860 [Armillaria borealis]|uniref:Uncharacterized protein n=1 Tax=Armillaria borealis TaxID=47425 RepID=A0AA39M5Q2_9AGAR|nr:hypothetical protein EV421DRAFT_589860 [Armillaria borealis]
MAYWRSVLVARRWAQFPAREIATHASSIRKRVCCEAFCLRLILSWYLGRLTATVILAYLVLLSKPRGLFPSSASYSSISYVMQIGSTHFPLANNMWRFLQTRRLWFQVIAAKSTLRSSKAACTSLSRIHLHKRITTGIWDQQRWIYSAFYWHIGEARAAMVGFDSQPERSERVPSQGREGVRCDTFCLETSSSRI